MMSRLILTATALMSAGSVALAQNVVPTGPVLAYPETPRTDMAEVHFGKTVSDPYRWLEADARTDPDVVAWVEAQNTVALDYLASLPGREVFRRRLQASHAHDRLIAPQVRGDHYFYTRRAPGQNQAALYVRQGSAGSEAVLIDPNAWSADGTSALAEWAVSGDGARVVYATQEAGSDWRTLRVLDVASGALLDDEVRWGRFTQISWLRDGSGFLYSRYPEPKADDSPGTALTGHAVYLHSIGDPQSSDRLIHATPASPELLHSAKVTDDGRYAVVNSTANLAQSALTVIDLEAADTKHFLVEDMDNAWSVVANLGSRLFVYSTRDAARGQVMTIDLSDAQPRFVTLIPEQPAVLNEVHRSGDQLLASYLVDAKTEIRRFGLDGSANGIVALPGIGTASSFSGDPQSDVVFFEFASFDTPTVIYRYDVTEDTPAVWADPGARINADRIVVEQRFFISRDGTRVPMFLVRRRDVTGPTPTLLYAYGGYGIPLTPGYSAVLMAWVEQGGVAAIANIRGGGEYGAAWHEAGRGLNRQRVFDDFIGAGEYLKAEGIAPAGGLAIYGDSNGGLLVGVATNQRPDLFDVALPQVGVMDMTRFNKFAGGTLWIGEYGNPEVEADFLNLLSYSPYHNVRSGQDYPAILATTADADNRVIPGHTFKYVAALQAADNAGKPHLVRIDTDTGHGSGVPTDKLIERTADMWSFAAEWTGLDLAPRD